MMMITTTTTTKESEEAADPTPDGVGDIDSPNHSRHRCVDLPTLKTRTVRTTITTTATTTTTSESEDKPLISQLEQMSVDAMKKQEHDGEETQVRQHTLRGNGNRSSPPPPLPSTVLLPMRVTSVAATASRNATTPTPPPFRDTLSSGGGGGGSGGGGSGGGWMSNATLAHLRDHSHGARGRNSGARTPDAVAATTTITTITTLSPATTTSVDDDVHKNNQRNHRHSSPFRWNQPPPATSSAVPIMATGSPSNSQVSVGSVGPTLVAALLPSRPYDLTPVTRNTSSSARTIHRTKSCNSSNSNNNNGDRERRRSLQSSGNRNSAKPNHHHHHHRDCRTDHEDGADDGDDADDEEDRLFGTAVDDDDDDYEDFNQADADIDGGQRLQPYVVISPEEGHGEGDCFWTGLAGEHLAIPADFMRQRSNDYDDGDDYDDDGGLPIPTLNNERARSMGDVHFTAAAVAFASKRSNSVGASSTSSSSLMPPVGLEPLILEPPSAAAQPPLAPPPIQFPPRKYYSFTSRQQYDESMKHYTLWREQEAGAAVAAGLIPYQPTREEDLINVGALPEEELNRIFIARRRGMAESSSSSGGGGGGGGGGGESHANHRLSLFNPIPMDDRQWSIPSLRLANHLHGGGGSVASLTDYTEDEDEESTLQLRMAAPPTTTATGANAHTATSADDDASLSSRGSLYLPAVDDGPSLYFDVGDGGAVGASGGGVGPMLLPWPRSSFHARNHHQHGHAHAIVESMEPVGWMEQQQAQDLMWNTSNGLAIASHDGNVEENAAAAAHPEGAVSAMLSSSKSRRKRKQQEARKVYEWLQSVEANPDCLAEAASSKFLLTGRHHHHNHHPASSSSSSWMRLPQQPVLGIGIGGGGGGAFGLSHQYHHHQQVLAQQYPLDRRPSLPVIPSRHAWTGLYHDNGNDDDDDADNDGEQFGNNHYNNNYTDNGHDDDDDDEDYEKFNTTRHS